MDILKAANKVGSVAGQAVAAAVQQRQLEIERKLLQDLRAEALALRARIGEEIFKQWKAGRVPPSGLDELLIAVDSTTTAIARQRGIIDQLQARPMAPQEEPYARARAIEEPAARIRVTEEPRSASARAGDGQAPDPLIAGGSDSAPNTCATCGATDVAGRPFCGFCGAKLE